jgi:uncharacterized protein YecT (DUF1311 family)
MRRPLTCFAMAFAAMLPAATTRAEAADALFDCATAATKVERAMCSDGQLSALYAQVFADFRRRLFLTPMDIRPVLTRVQRDWFAALERECDVYPSVEGGMGQCILGGLRRRAALLEDEIAKLQAARTPR